MRSRKSIPFIALLSLGAMCQTASAQDQTPKVEKYTVGAAGTRFSYVNGVFLLKCNRWEVKEVNKSGEIVSKCGNNTMYVTAESGNPLLALGW